MQMAFFSKVWGARLESKSSVHHSMGGVEFFPRETHGFWRGGGGPSLTLSQKAQVWACRDMCGGGGFECNIIRERSHRTLGKDGKASYAVGS